MNTFTRKRFGFGLIFVSVLAGLVLHLFGVPLITYESIEMPMGAKDGVSMMHIATCWPLGVLFVTAVIGTVLVARSRHERTNG
jgi:hypothetical protein